MLDFLIELGVALIFGLGLSFLSFGFALFYKTFFVQNNFRSNTLISLIAFVLMAIGSSLIFFIIV